MLLPKAWAKGKWATVQSNNRTWERRAANNVAPSLAGGVWRRYAIDEASMAQSFGATPPLLLDIYAANRKTTRRLQLFLQGPDTLSG